MRLRTLRGERAPWRPAFHELSCAFDAYEPWASAFAAGDAWPTLEAMSELVARAAREAGEPEPAIVRQPPRKSGSRDRSALYDARIVEQREVPTREQHWHDVMNALAWAGFPRAKWALHARQYRALCAAVGERFDAIPGARTATHDAIAMLDEGGVVLLVERSLADVLYPSLIAPDREPLAPHLREGRAALWVFGHGILESIALAAALPTVHAFAVTLVCDAVPSDPIASRALADSLLAAGLASGELPRPGRPRPSVTLDEPWLRAARPR
jgi:hypothetical protein